MGAAPSPPQAPLGEAGTSIPTLRGAASQRRSAGALSAPGAPFLRAPSHLPLGPAPPAAPIPAAGKREGAKEAIQRAERREQGTPGLARTAASGSGGRGAGMDAEYPAFEPPLCSELKHLCKRLQEAYRELKEDLTPFRDDRYYR